MRPRFIFLLVLLLSSLALTAQAATPPAAAEPTLEKKATKPAKTAKEKKAEDKAKAATDKQASEESLPPEPDIDETVLLPKYPAGARMSLGKMKTYTVGEEDTLLDIARHYRLGFIEMRAANPELDPWTPVPGETVTIPGFKLLPRAPQKGVVVNLAQMRLYYFEDGKTPVTFPIGVGREGLQTPTGSTSIIKKAAGPMWFPTKRMREEKPYLPAAVAAGPSNPLGTHALYLGWPEFLIHGSNKPWAIGRRVSSGCMRMYPEDISNVYDLVPVGAKVTVVDQPILVAWLGDDLYLEANPSKSQGNDIEIEGEHASKPLTENLKKVIIDAAGERSNLINWDIVATVIEERRGYPIMIASTKEPPAPVEKPKAPVVEQNFTYNN